MVAKISKSSSLAATEIEEIAVDIEAVIETVEDIEEIGTEEIEVIEEIEEETKGRGTATTVANLATLPETAPSVLLHCNLARKER